MSDDAQPVSVAELLARNGKQASSSGGRRRRGRGGISVAELTGDLAPVRDGGDSSSEDTAMVKAVVPDPVESTATSAWALPETAVDDLDATGAWPAPSVVPLRRLSEMPGQTVEQPASKAPLPAGYQPVIRPPRPELADFPTAAWAMTSQDQQLLSGPSLASDLLRGRSRGDEEDPTDEHDRVSVDDDRDEPSPEPAESVKDGAEERPAPAATRSERKRAASLRKWLPGTTATAGSAASDAQEQDSGARPWLILAGQAVLAALVGVLIFKGFQRLWIDLPWIALALAIIVIVGLVAVVRVLRKTDDVVSMLIAVAVGVFVTVGPLVLTFSTG